MKNKALKSPYVLPKEVVSPKRQWTHLDVLFDGGEWAHSVVLGRWKNEPGVEKACLAMRWNGFKGKPKGNPQSRGYPTWFVIPDDFESVILDSLPKIEPSKIAYARSVLKKN